MVDASLKDVSCFVGERVSEGETEREGERRGGRLKETWTRRYRGFN